MFLKDLFFRLLSMTVWKGKVHSPKVQSKTVNLSHNRHLPNRGWNHDNARCSTCALLSEVLNCAGGIVCFEGFLFTSLSKIWQRSELINLDQFPEHSEKDRERERYTKMLHILSLMSGLEDLRRYFKRHRNKRKSHSTDLDWIYSAKHKTNFVPCQLRAGAKPPIISWNSSKVLIIWFMVCWCTQ